jgi:sec-independent protein translocase protein TatA
MARSVGQSARVFKGEMKGLRDDEARSATPPQQNTRPAPAEPPALPPSGQSNGQVNGQAPYAGEQQGSEPVRRDADR